MTDEKQRMDQVFRGLEAVGGKYSLDNPGNRFNFELLRADVLGRLPDIGIDLPKTKVLDLGAGELFWGNQFIAMGCKSEHYVGVDLLLWRLQKGHAFGRNHQAVAASATELPFPDSTFGLISQFTMMTSVLDEAVKGRIAAEMIRVLKPHGYILWYDFRYSNPSNPNARGIGQRELRGLFPGLPVSLQTTTLLPPLARKLRPPLLNFFHAFPILRTHYLAWIGPKG
jgi:ubiquinone/menaquinone biosynthesis C-methylase UbiE